jgi:membrane protein YqaA with SNARE-associated domain
MMPTRRPTTKSTALAHVPRAIFALSYPFAVGVVAFILTISMLSVASVLIVAVLLRRERWGEIVILASLGSAIGGLTLYLIFHHLGWSHILAAYPELTRAKAWSDATLWVSAYGTWALLVIAASPLPQTPALVFAALSQLPIVELFLALFVGKLLKYGIYGFLAARFPSWLAAGQTVIRSPL